MYRYFRARITGNSLLNEHFRLLRVSPLSEVISPEPGQFYMLQVGRMNEPLLKRPFSVFKQDGKALEFVYRIRGKGTRSLANFSEGDILSLIGPLGNAYPVPDCEFIVVAGGIGFASLLSLLERYPGQAHLFYGARNKDELVMLDEAKRVSKKVHVSTDDGSFGHKGLVTDIMKEFIDSVGCTPGKLRVYVCGSKPMMKEVSGIVCGRGLQCHVSLEEHMACGVGACLGCVVKIRIQNSEFRIQNNSSRNKEGTVPDLRTERSGVVESGLSPRPEFAYQRVCKEGPVFDAKEIVWD